jgi:hypothetical protein
MADPVAYQEVTADDYAAKFAQKCKPTKTRRGVLLRGTCPRCDDPMEFPVVTEAYQSVSAGNLGPAPAGTEETPLLCTCKSDHPNRPSDEEGCGAYWNLRLTRRTS